MTCDRCGKERARLVMTLDGKMICRPCRAVININAFLREKAKGTK